MVTLNMCVCERVFELDNWPPLPPAKKKIKTRQWCRLLLFSNFPEFIVYDMCGVFYFSTSPSSLQLPIKTILIRLLMVDT